MRRAALIAGLLSVAAATAAPGREPLPSATGRLQLAAGAEPGSYLVQGDGTGELFELPPGLRPTALAELEAGWLLTGTLPDGDGHRLHLLARLGQELRELPEPPGASALHRVGPQPLVERGRPLGLAWLEGDGLRALAVRVATWADNDWVTGPWVSNPGPGSQLALAATVLADGRWLLVWSAFDGEDDEIHWSVGDGERFSPPLAIQPDNRVPDITPALARAGDGALAAWSSYDGNDYRLRLARFDGEGWSLLPWTGGRGSLEAGFLTRDDLLLLLYRTVDGDSWSLLQLAADGRVERLAVAPASPAARPAVRLDEAGPVLVWPERAEAVELEWQQP